MIEALLNKKIEKRPETVRLRGRILFLTEDPELIKRQLAGENLPWDTGNRQNNPKLRDDISTDEITPAHICFFFDETLGEFPYTGLKCSNDVPIQRGDVKRGGFVAAVSGKRRGKGGPNRFGHVRAGVAAGEVEDQDGGVEPGRAVETAERLEGRGVIADRGVFGC